jgi:hypothetical protein
MTKKIILVIPNTRMRWRPDQLLTIKRSVVSLYEMRNFEPLKGLFANFEGETFMWCTSRNLSLLFIGNREVHLVNCN